MTDQANINTQTAHDAHLLFQDQSIRSHWDDDQEKWFFSVQDIVQIISESRDVKQYIKRMRSRNIALNANWGTICTPLEMVAADGRGE